MLIKEQDRRQSASPNFGLPKNQRQFAEPKNSADLRPQADRSVVRTSLISDDDDITIGYTKLKILARTYVRLS